MDLMKGFPVFVAAFALLAAGCGSSSTSPSTTAPTKPTLTATLSPANEVPAITSGPEASGSGTVTITLDTTTNASGQITAATATFVVNLSGFPANTPINAAHIHVGANTCACPVAVSVGLAAGANVLTNGSGSITVSGVNVTADLASAILANPSGYYFNVHSTLNPGGVARGTLVRAS
jgi:CHRD domain-containing protein